MQTVGYIDIEKYRCIAENITTDEVIITPERIQHIEQRHPGDYEKIAPHLQAALKSPDYILQDKSPNSGLILKTIEENGLKFQIILRIHTPADPPNFKNSIISAWRIRENEYKRLIRSKKILYRQE